MKVRILSLFFIFACGVQQKPPSTSLAPQSTVADPMTRHGSEYPIGEMPIVDMSTEPMWPGNAGCGKFFIDNGSYITFNFPTGSGWWNVHADKVTLMIGGSSDGHPVAEILSERPAVEARILISQKDFDESPCLNRYRR